MTLEEFRKAVEAKFNFEDGWFQGDGERLTTAGPQYQMSYEETEDGDQVNPHLEVIDEPMHEYGEMIDGFEEFEVEEADSLFHARTFMTANGEEFVYIEEEGPWHGYVFLNYHDEGLFSIEELHEEFDWLADEFDSPNERLEETPFFQNPVAKSLDEFFSMLTVVSADEF